MSKRIDEVVGLERPAILHAHSPSLWGMATAHVAKRRSIPFIYEVRGIWEDAAVDQNKATRHSLRYRLSRALESTVVRKANHVVAIAHGLQDDLIQRGIHPSKFSIVNNGVDREYFFPLVLMVMIRSCKLGLHDGPELDT